MARLLPRRLSALGHRINPEAALRRRCLETMHRKPPTSRAKPPLPDRRLRVHSLAMLESRQGAFLEVTPPRPLNLAARFSGGPPPHLPALRHWATPAVLRDRRSSDRTRTHRNRVASLGVWARTRLHRPPPLPPLPRRQPPHRCSAERRSLKRPAVASLELARSRSHRLARPQQPPPAVVSLEEPIRTSPRNQRPRRRLRPLRRSLCSEVRVLRHLRKDLLCSQHPPLAQTPPANPHSP